MKRFSTYTRFAACVAAMIIMPLASNALQADDYFPFIPNFQYVRIKNGKNPVIDIVHCCEQVNFNSTNIITNNDVRLNFTNDLNGLRFHGITVSPSGANPPTTTARGRSFTPPIRVTKSEFNIGDTVDSSGAVGVSTNSGLVTINYSATATVDALEPVTVPMNQFDAVKLTLTIRIFGNGVDEIETRTFWLARFVGIVKEIVRDDDGDTNVYDLSTISPLAFGEVAVTLTPDGAVHNGAQWRLISNNGGFDSGFRNSGTELTDLTIGNYTMTFNNVAGWIKPGDQSIELFLGAKNRVMGNYSSVTGDVSVTILPEAATISAAQWKISNSVTGYDSGFLRGGEVLNDIPIGEYLLEFRDLSSWITPNPRTITVPSGTLISPSGVYIPRTGDVSITIAPMELRGLGAQWRIRSDLTGFDSGYQDSGAELDDLLIGTYRLEFNEIDCWSRPVSQIIIINESSRTDIAGQYVRNTGNVVVTIDPEDVVDLGAQWKIVGGVSSFDSGFRNSGSQLQEICAGNYTLRFNSVSGWVAPFDRTLLVSNGDPVIVPAVYSVDADDDGLADDWEISHFTDQNQNPNDDFDGDGFSNLQEFRRNSDPIAYSIHLDSGWNLVSCARVPDSNSVASMFPGIAVSPRVWTWRVGRFTSCDKIEPLSGYWLYLNGPPVDVPIIVDLD